MINKPYKTVNDLERFESHGQVCAMIEETRASQSYIYDTYLVNTRFYLDKNITGFSPGNYQPGAQENSFMLTQHGLVNDRDDVYLTQEMSWNCIKASCDAVIAQVCSYTPDIKFLPNNADRAVASKTSKLEKFVRGVKQRARVGKLARMCMKDAAICGPGYAKVYVEDKEVKVERVHPDYITVPEQTSLLGKPQWMSQHSWLSVTDLIAFTEQFVDKKRKDLILEQLEISPGVDLSTLGDLVKVYEMWCLPAGSIPGRHVIFTEKFTLVDEEWENDFFPFVSLVWEQGMLGQHGTSYVTDLVPIQQELNYMLRKRAEHMAVISHAYVTLKTGDMMTKEQLQDFPMFSILESSDPASIKFNIPDGSHPSWNQYIQELWAKAFETKGVSPEVAQGKKEAGLTAGIAIRLSQDIQAQRMSEYSNNWNQFHKDMTSLIIKVAKAHDGELISKSTSDKFVDSIKWKEVNIADDVYDITVDATNPLSRGAAGRIDNIIELSQAVQMPPEVLLGMINHPDIDAYLEKESAPLNAVKSFIERCLDKMEALPIPKFLNLEILVKIGTQYYSDLLDNEADEKEVLIIEELLDEVLNLMEPAEEPEGPPPEVPPDMPMPELPPDMPPMPDMPLGGPDNIPMAPEGGMAPPMPPPLPPLPGMPEELQGAPAPLPELDENGMPILPQ